MMGTDFWFRLRDVEVSKSSHHRNLDLDTWNLKPCPCKGLEVSKRDVG